jgi:hypothetical protein
MHVCVRVCTEETKKRAEETGKRAGEAAQEAGRAVEDASDGVREQVDRQQREAHEHDEATHQVRRPACACVCLRVRKCVYRGLSAGVAMPGEGKRKRR